MRPSSFTVSDRWIQNSMWHFHMLYNIFLLQDGKSVYTLLTLYGFIPFPSAYSIIIVMMTMVNIDVRTRSRSICKIHRRLTRQGIKYSTRTVQMQRQLFTMQLLQVTYLSVSQNEIFFRVFFHWQFSCLPFFLSYTERLLELILDCCPFL